MLISFIFMFHVSYIVKEEDLLLPQEEDLLPQEEELLLPQEEDLCSICIIYDLCQHFRSKF